MPKAYSPEIMNRIFRRLQVLYGDRAPQCMERMEMLIGRYGIGIGAKRLYGLWNQSDIALITYGDMVKEEGKRPLQGLKRFLDERCNGAINSVHILPFCPYSSDDGFSVIDYREIDPDLGEWEDVETIAGDYRLMGDLVLNHCSRQSSWFRNYTLGIAPFRDYFIEADPNADLSAVVRPRSLPLLTPTQTISGERHVWTTFSDDQIDVNFASPDVLFDFLDILFLYISKGVRIVRLDAIAYLWKEIGTSCIHLSQTHEVVKLFRDVLDMVAPDVILITETNVPHEENISYFGDGDEARMVYQFSLPPLLLHALQSGNASFLTEWAGGLGDVPEGCTYFNFTASHDGVGVRPLAGLIPDGEFAQLIEGMKARGAHVSTKRDSDGTDSPYELNITYFDALGEPGSQAPRAAHIHRFLCSQTIMLELRGLPAVYFNNLVAARNNVAGVEETGRARTINREKWVYHELNAMLNDPNHHSAVVYREFVRRMRIRAEHASFHPDGPQRVLDAGPGLFAVERSAPDGSERLVCVSNVTDSPQALPKSDFFPWKIGKDLLSTQSGKRPAKLEPYQTCWFEEKD